MSLANLCFMAVWPALISQSLNPQAQYARYRLSGYVAILINVFVLATLFWISITLIRRYGNEKVTKITRAIFLIVLILPIHAIIKTQAPRLALESPFYFFGSSRRTLLSLIVVSLIIFLIHRFHGVVIKITSVLLLLMVPFALWTVGKTVYLMTRFADKPAAPLIERQSESTPRILWMIFDEMDQRIAFADRPAGLELPNLDRLREESIYSTNAYPPSTHTLMSIPALISGRLVSSAYVRSPSDLMITYEESEERVRWGDDENIFSEARRLGRNTALVGWYHPYCRMIGDSLSRCFFEDNKKMPLSLALLNQLRDVALSFPFASSIDSLRNLDFAVLRKGEESRRRYRAQMYKRMMDAAIRYSTDPNLGLVMLHMPVPHAPVIYNRHKQDFKAGKSTSYLDNLALVDRAMGELRAEMESTGYWDNTVVIITSDHPISPRNWKNRFAGLDQTETSIIGSTTDPRIPFILKLAGQKQAAMYEQPFNTVITRDLLLALLRGDVSTPQQVMAWIDRNRTIAESPYKKNRSNSEHP